MKNILLINGPNLNLLGKRDVEIYGNKTIGDVKDMLVKFINEKDLENKYQIKSYQSNHEGDLIDFIQENSKHSHAIIINPGGLTTVGFSFDNFFNIGFKTFSTYATLDSGDLSQPKYLAPKQTPLLPPHCKVNP